MYPEILVEKLFELGLLCLLCVELQQVDGVLAPVEKQAHVICNDLLKDDMHYAFA